MNNHGKLRITTLLFLAITFIATERCTWEKEDGIFPPDTTVVDTCLIDTVSYSQDIEPIISTNCYGCHPASGYQQAGVNLEGYDALTSHISNGTLSAVVNYESGISGMPPSGKLSPCKVAIIDTWIIQGFPNN